VRVHTFTKLRVKLTLPPVLPLIGGFLRRVRRGHEVFLGFSRRRTGRKRGFVRENGGLSGVRGRACGELSRAGSGVRNGVIGMNVRGASGPIPARRDRLRFVVSGRWSVSERNGADFGRDSNGRNELLTGRKSGWNAAPSVRNATARMCDGILGGTAGSSRPLCETLRSRGWATVRRPCQNGSCWRQSGGAHTISCRQNGVKSAPSGVPCGLLRSL